MVKVAGAAYVAEISARKPVIDKVRDIIHRTKVTILIIIISTFSNSNHGNLAMIYLLTISYHYG